MQGQVLEVSITTQGDELAIAHAAGATTLTLMSVAEFASETGGFLQIEGEVYEYDTVNATANTLHLLAGLATAREEGERVLTLPLSEEKFAMVEVRDFDEPISARVSHGLKDKMEDGVREPEDQETVVLELVDGDWTVTDIIYEVPSFDGQYITPGTLPEPDGSDGNAPPAIPSLEVIDGIGAFYLRWVPPVNADPMRFEVHVKESATVPAGPPTPGDPTTLAAETEGYAQTLRAMPGTDPETGLPVKFKYTVEGTPEDPLSGDHPYWFAVIPKDEDGPGPATAWVVSRLYQVTGEDIRAHTIKGENIFFTTLTGDLFSASMALATTISTGAMDDDGNIVGARVELGPEGIYTYDAAEKAIVKFPTDGSGNAFVKADFEMLSAKVNDNFSMFGTNNQIGKNGRLMLAAGVLPPSAPPTVTYDYDRVQLNTTTAVPPMTPNTGYNLGTFKFDPSQATSITWDWVWGCWVVIQQKSGGFRIWRFTSTGAIYNNFGTGRPWIDDFNDRSDCTAAYGTDPGGTNVASLFKQGGVWYVSGPTRINRIPDSWILDVDARPPVLGYDAVNGQFMIAQSNGGGNGTFHVRRFTLNAYSGSGPFPNATSQGTFSGEAASGWGKRPNGVYFGPGDFASGNRYAWSVDDYTTIAVFGTDGVMRDNEGIYENWTKDEAGLGFCWDGTQFVSINGSGRLTKYPNWNWTTVSSTVWIGASAFDSDTAGDPANPHVGQTAGQHETPVGSLQSFNLRRRAKLVITMPETPDTGGTDDVDKWKLYWARQTAVPTKTQMKYIDMIGSPTAATSKTITADPTGGNPPGGIQGQSGTVNNFPSANPAKLISAGTDSLGAPLIDFTGDGTGRIGPWKFGADGKTEFNSGPERPGTMFVWPGNTIPLDVAECNGQAVPRPKTAGAGGVAGNPSSTSEVYRRVWEVIGTTYGAGDGSTTFNLPDLVRRVPVGAGGGISPGRNEGITTQSSRTFAHNHAHTHTHGIPGQTAGATVSGGTASGSAPTNGAYSGHAHGGDTNGASSSSTSNSAFDDIPSLCIRWVIKL